MVLDVRNAILTQNSGIMYIYNHKFGLLNPEQLIKDNYETDQFLLSIIAFMIFPPSFAECTGVFHPLITLQSTHCMIYIWLCDDHPSSNY